MANIGGNIFGMIQTKTTEGKNAIGEAVSQWADKAYICGWLGLQNGEQKHTTFNAKIEESTHVFLTDFRSDVYALADTDARMQLKGNVYEVTFIDNPDELDEQLEIYLKKVGGQNGS